MPMPPSIKAYPDQPVLENRSGDDGMIGSRQEKIALIPSEAGTLTLPAIEIPWWNTDTQQMEIARIPSKTLVVLPALGSSGNSPIPAPATTVQPMPAPAAPANGWLAGGADRFWPWLSLGLAMAWLLTAAGWWRSQRRAQTRVLPANKSPGEKQLLAEVQKACAANNAEATKVALLRWASLRWPGGRIHSLGDLAAQFDGDLQAELHKLSQSLYSGAAASWQGGALWTSFAGRQQTPVPAPTQPELEPLYIK